MPTKKNIKTPEILYKHFESYKKDCKLNPKYEYQFVPSMKKEVGVTREVPYTLDGFEIWLRKNEILCKLDDYIANKDNRYSQYADIIHAIRQEIYQDKYNGSVAGVFNANIIARDLGLKDTTVNEIEDKRKTVNDLFPNLDESD